MPRANVSHCRVRQEEEPKGRPIPRLKDPRHCAKGPEQKESQTPSKETKENQETAHVKMS